MAVTRYILVFITLLIASEIFVRLFFMLPSSVMPDKDIGWMYKPNARIFTTHEGRAVNEMNSLGLNDDEIGAKIRKRLIVLGDSYTEALHVTRENNFTSILESYLQDVDVINLGRSGLSPIHYPIIVKKYYQTINPDEALLVLTSGDLNDILNKKIKILYEGGEVKSIYIKPQTLNPLRIKLDSVFSHSALTSFLLYRLKQLMSTDDIKVEVKGQKLQMIKDKKTEIVNVLKYLLDEIKSYLPVKVVYIPRLIYLPKKETAESDISKATANIIDEVTMSMGIPFLHAGKYLRDAYEINGQPAVGFSNKSITSGHLNLEGHKAIANALLPFVEN